MKIDPLGNFVALSLYRLRVADGKSLTDFYKSGWFYSYVKLGDFEQLKEDMSSISEMLTRFCNEMGITEELLYPPSSFSWERVGKFCVQYRNISYWNLSIIKDDKEFLNDWAASEERLLRLVEEIRSASL